MKRFAIGFMLLFLLVGSVSGAMAMEIKVGTLMAFTGPLKEFGPPIRSGAILAKKQLEKAGLKVKLVQEDSETNPVAGVNAAKKLVNINKVPVIIGAFASSVTVSVAESVTIPNGVLMISPASTSPLITYLPVDKGKDLLFRTCPSDALQGIAAGKIAAKYYKTASVLYVNNPYGQGLAQEFKKSFEKHGGKVLAMVPHEEKTSETYTAELKKALKGKPDVLCAYSYPQHAKIYLKEAIEFYKFKKFLFCDGTKSVDIIKAVGAKNLEGDMGTAAASTTGKAGEVFNKAYKAEFGKLPPIAYISNAYDAMAVIGLAAYATKVKGLPLTSKNIRDNLRKVANPPGTVILPGEFAKAFKLIKEGKEINYEGAGGAVDFDKNGDVVSPIEIWKFTGGEIKAFKVINLK
ncbi:MAG: amino acid ABC transporter substrate-binding protein [Deltaproteobacteria bacterium]|nr:MAG: amino acid ABC transporter substrate-binding protein [Deltaproteobacteria bacterium]